MRLLHNMSLDYEDSTLRAADCHRSQIYVSDEHVSWA